MTTQEIEERTGMDRANLRFYEREGLLTPDREPGNRYRSYTEEDVEVLRKIRYLRLLGFSVAEIRELQVSGEPLGERLKRRREALKQQEAEAGRLADLCGRLDSTCNFDSLSLTEIEEQERLWQEQGRRVRSEDQNRFGIALAASMILTTVTGLADCCLLSLSGFARDEGFYAPDYYGLGLWLVLAFSVLLFGFIAVQLTWLKPRWKWVAYPLIALYFAYAVSVFAGLLVFWQYAGFL
ncbi:MAG: MerR family transcriptional regulator [Candidatus Onthomonas sp.]